MSESSQLDHRTEFKEAENSAIHTGSGNININVLAPGWEKIFTLLKELGTHEEAKAVEKFYTALRLLGRCQKVVSELKRIHNMLHELEVALAVVDSQIQIPMRRKKIVDFFNIETNWRIAVRPRIQDMAYFASNEMAFLDEPRYIVTAEKMEGPQWIIDLVTLQRDFEISMKEQNTKAIAELSTNVLDNCREHLLRIDRRLLEAVNRVDQLSDQILMRIDNG